MALETPVLFLLKNDHRETDRFKGLIELTHSLSEDEYVENPQKYNINNPPKNRKDYLKLRKSLTEKCKKFTGFFNDEGFLTGELPFQLGDNDFIQRFFDSLYRSYRFQNLENILKNKSEYISTEIEGYARHLKVVEVEYMKLENQYNDLSQKYNRITKYPRIIKNKMRRPIGENGEE
jgi:hypothetical protein